MENKVFTREKLTELCKEAEKYGWQITRSKNDYTSTRGENITLPLFDVLPPLNDPRLGWTSLWDKQRATVNGIDCFIFFPDWFEREVINDRNSRGPRGNRRHSTLVIEREFSDLSNDGFLKLLDEAKSYGWRLIDEKRTYTDYRGYIHEGQFVTLPIFTILPPENDPRGKWTWTEWYIQRLTLDGKDCFIDMPTWFEEEVIKDAERKRSAEDQSADQSAWSWLYDLIWAHYATKGESPF